MPRFPFPSLPARAILLLRMRRRTYEVNGYRSGYSDWFPYYAVDSLPYGLGSWSNPVQQPYTAWPSDPETPEPYTSPSQEYVDDFDDFFYGYDNSNLYESGLQDYGEITVTSAGSTSFSNQADFHDDFRSAELGNEGAGSELAGAQKQELTGGLKEYTDGMPHGSDVGENQDPKLAEQWTLTFWELYRVNTSNAIHNYLPSDFFDSEILEKLGKKWVDKGLDTTFGFMANTTVKMLRENSFSQFYNQNFPTYNLDTTPTQWKHLLEHENFILGVNTPIIDVENLDGTSFWRNPSLSAWKDINLGVSIGVGVSCQNLDRTWRVTPHWTPYFEYNRDGVMFNKEKSKIGIEFILKPNQNKSFKAELNPDGLKMDGEFRF